MARPLGVVIVTAALVASAHHARASDPELTFDIPSQPLEAALDAYGAVSRLQVLYETSLTAGRRSTAVKGVYAQEAALRLLLSGTGLGFDYTAERAFTLVPVRRLPPARVADFEPFLGVVQAGILAALCRNPQTRPGPFRLAMQFRIDGAGRLSDPSLLDTTGAPARDAAVTAALSRLAFGRAPPPGMPQPVTMVLRPGAAPGPDECPEARP